jgi:hypothetical protein
MIFFHGKTLQQLAPRTVCHIGTTVIGFYLRGVSKIMAYSNNTSTENDLGRKYVQFIMLGLSINVFTVTHSEHVLQMWHVFASWRKRWPASSLNMKNEPLILTTLKTGDADLHFYITTVRDGWRKSAFLTRACFPCTVHLIMQYIETVSEWSCWRVFIETWPHSELNFRHRASSIQGQAFHYSPENAFYIFNQQIYFIIWYLLDGASLI